MKTAKHILPVIVFAQFCCTSLWFAGNGIISNLISNFNLEVNAMGHLTSAVQFGFIIGTLVFALFTVADRFSPSKVFFTCALAGAGINLLTLLPGNGLASLLAIRFVTGFFLAGIYPVGMKIAADHFDKGLGKSLGFLVGALVLGTAFPHLLKGFEFGMPWQAILGITSGLATLGGGMMLFLVPNGPFRKASQKPDFSALFVVFRNRNFRSAAFGYFGHMWELYAFWAFVPAMLRVHLAFYPEQVVNVPLWSFIIIASGAVSCVIGGILSQYWGTKKVASVALALSGACCLLFPLLLSIGSLPTFIGFFIFWGLAVIADSPLFSTLIAQNAPPENKGTALTIVNSIGFAITIVSIQLLTGLGEVVNLRYMYAVLALGPVLGLVGLWGKGTNS